VTIKYSNAGAPLWTNRYNGPQNLDDWINGVAVDRAGNVFVTGESSGAGSFATLAYSSAGVPLWTNRYDSGFGKAIAVDRNGNVFVTGGSWNGTNYDWVTIKYSSSIPLPRLDLKKLNNQLVLSWTNSSFNLQSAPFVNGSFTNIADATSPYTNSLSAPRKFFRLIGN